MCVRVCVGEGVDRMQLCYLHPGRTWYKERRLALSDWRIFQRAGINPAYARVQLSEGAGA